MCKIKSTNGRAYITAHVRFAPWHAGLYAPRAHLSHFTICIIFPAMVHACYFHNSDPSGRNQSHVGRVRFPLRVEMHGGGLILPILVLLHL